MEQNLGSRPQHLKLKSDTGSDLPYYGASGTILDIHIVILGHVEKWCIINNSCPNASA